MNTTKIGDAFEEDCFAVIKDALKQEKLGLIPEQVEVRQKAAYFSTVRETNIIFDLSIEVTPPGADRSTLLYLIECKDYSGSVPVSDIEEFCSKVGQVAHLNCKAVFITRGGLQSGAWTLAKNKGIMVIQVSENLTYDIVLYKTNRVQQKRTELAADPSHSPTAIDIRILVETAVLRAFTAYVKQTLPTEKNYAVPHLSSAEIDHMCTGIINAIDEVILSNGRSVDTNKLIGFMKDSFNLAVVREELQLDSEGRKILSSCSFKERLIRVSPTLDDKRYKFALAHEFGHFLLHNKLIIGQSTYETMEDSEFNFRTGRNSLVNERQWIEWQANEFASLILMPEVSVKYQFARNQRNGKLRRLYVDKQPDNQKEYFRMLRCLSDYFGVSKECIKYRLLRLELVDLRVVPGTATMSEHLKHFFGQNK